MTCATCGCLLTPGQACVGGDGVYRHAEPETCIQLLKYALGGSRRESYRRAELIAAMSAVVYAARLLRVRAWLLDRAVCLSDDRRAIWKARLALRDARDAFRDATAAYVRGEGR